MSIDSNSVGNFYISFEWARTNVIGRTEYVHYRLVAHTTPGSYRTVYARRLWINDNEKLNVSGDGGANATRYYDGDEITSGDFTLTCDVAGNAWFTVSFEAGVGTWPGTNASAVGTPWLDQISLTGPGVPGRQYINGKTSETVLERNTNVNLTWDEPGGGTDGISGYKVYYSNGNGWQRLGTTTSRSYTVNLSQCWNAIPRGGTIGFQITAYNAYFESDKHNDAFGNNRLTLATMTANTSNQNVQPQQARINWSSNIAVKTVEYKHPVSSTWHTASSNINTSSGYFTITGLRSGTTQSVEVRLTARSDNATANSTTTFTTVRITSALTYQDVTPIQARINWSCNVAIKQVSWRISSNDNWKLVSQNLNTTSGNFIATGLPYNTNINMQVLLVPVNDITNTTPTTNLTTKDIARITQNESEWSVEDSTMLSITNNSGCTMQLYMSYNNVEIISRNNLTLTNGKYTLTLTQAEKTLLYNQASTDQNPNFKFILKSFLSSKVGEDIKNTKVTFPTKAWVKVDGVWKRALVWCDNDNNKNWKQCLPWIKKGGSNTWQII